MGKIKHESDRKWVLVSEICSIPTSPVSCVHNSTSCFIDWYLILAVEEDAKADVIRRRYHALALQIHPDKNNHPKADIAFKLIHQAYSCLSDESKRRSFNSEREKRICPKCNRSSLGKRTETKPNRFSQTLRDIRDRFREENKVIERCLKANTARFPGNQTEETPVFGIPNRFGRESPVFDPSDYRFRGYPHVRNRVFERAQGFGCLDRNNIHDLPVFEKNISDWRMFRSRSTCVRSS
ncbi:PREDICTED: uncharacterized protein LOC104827079 [Tarenaya hassleriana]|uniref:uncharacterized protein LOC104827079 n=1 Tax=Tarenaya hassleriana TaxID=28532 RepID=UPI00053C4FF6|nr:PREDICTED: uncharacterized protein LOC104827079 [Tarenaya hassleriana]